MKVTPFRARWIGRLGALVLRLLGRTWRVRQHGAELPHWAVVGAFHHGSILMAAYVFRDLNAAVMISQHGDGELITQVAQRLGIAAVRGSTTRGGARAVRAMLAGYPDQPWAITPDGPRGPRGRVHPGIIMIAGASGRPIYPLGFALSRGTRLRSWDRFAIPWPFARIVVHVGEPISVAGDLDREQRAAAARELELRLAAAEEAAAAGLTHKLVAVRWPPRSKPARRRQRAV